jgi:hypothetical protein
LRFFHATPTPNVASICGHGLRALYYGRHPVLVDDAHPSVWRSNLAFYKSRPRCQRDPRECSVVIFELNRREVAQYLRPGYRGKVPGLWALAGPLPARFAVGQYHLGESRRRLRPCPVGQTKLVFKSGQHPNWHGCGRV